MFQGIDISIGKIESIQIWENRSNVDNRGKLIKVYQSNLEVFSKKFMTVEHFFTFSKENVFRGMHFQTKPHALEKIISIVQGSAKAFLLDINHNSKTYGNLQIISMYSDSPISIYIPTEIAFGYLALEENTIISYRTNADYCVNCDDGFNVLSLKDHISIDLKNTIQSERDLHLELLENYIIKTACKFDSYELDNF
jgi:dTDP-4-dehydrorhamnose 3,5-epimerase-like enzyme